MLRILHFIAFASLLLLLTLFSSDAESQATDYAEIEFYLGKEGGGEFWDLTTESPTSDRTKYWKARDDANQAETYFPLVSWETSLGGNVYIGDSFSYVFWVESTNVQEIKFRTTLSVFTPFIGTTNISVVETTKSAALGGPEGPGWLNENYTLELESSALDKSGFPDGIPAYSVFSLVLETSVTWAPDTANRTVWVKGASPEFDSSFIIDFGHVYIDGNTSYFENVRVDEVGEDRLRIKVTVSNALGVENFDLTTVNIKIQGIAGGGKFKNSIIASDKHIYAKYIQGIWWYQEDQGVNQGYYDIEISVKDIWGNLWSSQVSYELIVDQYGLEIEFGEGYSPNGQLPRGGDEFYEFIVHNRGNTRDLFEIEVEDSDLPSGWSVDMITSSILDIQEGDSDYVQLKIEAPASAKGGSEESVTIIVTSTSNNQIREEVRLKAEIRSYGVTFVSSPEKISIDPDSLDVDGNYRFSINVRNTGSDKDTYRLDATTARSDWSVRIELDGAEVQSITIDKSKTEEIEIVVKPVNYEDTLGEEVGFLLSAGSVSPGDGFASLSLGLFVEIPVDRIIDLSLDIEDILINGKPPSLLAADDLKSENPIQIQVTIQNKGGKSAGTFTVKLYLGQLVIDEYTVSQGIRGFGSEPVVLEWENPSSGLSTLKIFVDFEKAVDELNSNRADNSISLPVTVSEKSGTGIDGISDSDNPLITIGPVATLSIIGLLSVFYRRFE